MSPMFGLLLMIVCVFAILLIRTILVDAHKYERTKSPRALALIAAWSGLGIQEHTVLRLIYHLPSLPDEHRLEETTRLLQRLHQAGALFVAENVPAIVPAYYPPTRERLGILAPAARTCPVLSLHEFPSVAAIAERTGGEWDKHSKPWLTVHFPRWLTDIHALTAQGHDYTVAFTEGRHVHEFIISGDYSQCDNCYEYTIPQITITAVLLQANDKKVQH